MARRTRRKPRKRKRKGALPSKQIGAAVKRRGTKGKFRAWCKARGYSKVTAACIAQGLRSRSTSVQRMAKAAKAYATMRRGK